MQKLYYQRHRSWVITLPLSTSTLDFLRMPMKMNKQIINGFISIQSTGLHISAKKLLACSAFSFILLVAYLFDSFTMRWIILSFKWGSFSLKAKSWISDINVLVDVYSFPSPPMIWVVLLLDLSCDNMPHLLTYWTMSTCFIPMYCRPTITMSTLCMLTCLHLWFLICRSVLTGRGALVLFSGGRVSSLLDSENVYLL